jgi:iron complex outermembrane receptor protein
MYTGREKKSNARMELKSTRFSEKVKKIQKLSNRFGIATSLTIYSCLLVYLTSSTITGILAFAQEPETLDEVVVEAQKEAPETLELKDQSAFVTVIKSEEFQEEFTSIPEVLEQSVGLNVRNFGGLGAFSTASIRGSSAEQVTVLLDGIPLNRGRNAVVNLSNIPLRSVERIEIYRGAAPLRFRSSAIGGVINIVTKRIKEGFSHQVSGSYGSFNTYEAAGTSTGQVQKAGYLLSASTSGSDGDFEFEDDNGTPLNPSDDTKKKRENNDFTAYDILGKMSYDFSTTFRLEASNNFFAKEEGVPGISSNQSQNARLETDRNILSVKGLKERFFLPNLDAEFTGYYLIEKTNFDDPDGEIGVGRQDTTDDSNGWGLDGYVSYYWGDHQILSFLGSFQQEIFDSKDNLAKIKDSDTQTRNIYQAGIEDEIYLWHERLTFAPQLLYTYLQNDFGGDVSSLPFPVPSADDDDFLSGKIGAKFQVWNGLYLKGNLGRFYRYPTLTELFGDRGVVIGNPDLKPEEGINADIGMTFKMQDFKLGKLPVNRLYGEAVYFRNAVDDLVLFQQTSQRTVQPVNISQAEVEGVELNWGFTVFNHFALSGNYTYQDAKNTSDIPFLNGNRLPGVPENELFLRTELFNRWTKLFYEYNYLSDNFLDQANIRKVDSRNIHNAGISVYPFKFTTVTFEVKNIGDEQVADVLGFPLPGRSYFGTVLFEF